MYSFVRGQTRPAGPADLQGWYLVLKPDDVDTFMELHLGVAGFYYSKFGMDPHITEFEIGYNPIVLVTKWLSSIEHYRLNDTTLAINSSGGMVPLDSVKVLAETRSKKMIWPTLYEDEIITISRWPECRHYYLSSNKSRIFVPPKYIDYKAAVLAAEKYTDNVKTKGF